MRVLISANQLYVNILLVLIFAIRFSFEKQWMNLGPKKLKIVGFHTNEHKTLIKINQKITFS